MSPAAEFCFASLQARLLFGSVHRHRWQRIHAHRPFIQYSLGELIVSVLLISPWLEMNIFMRPLAVYEPWIPRDSAWEYGFPVSYFSLHHYGSHRNFWWPALVIDAVLPSLQFFAALLLFSDIRNARCAKKDGTSDSPPAHDSSPSGG